MHFGAEIEWVKWVYLVVKCAIEGLNQRNCSLSSEKGQHNPTPCFVMSVKFPMEQREAKRLAYFFFPASVGQYGPVSQLSCSH